MATLQVSEEMHLLREADCSFEPRPAVQGTLKSWNDCFQCQASYCSDFKQAGMVMPDGICRWVAVAWLGL